MTSGDFTHASDRLDVDKAIALLNPEGPFSTVFKGFEARHEQKEMMRNVLEAYNRSHIALIEAGTGTGKSLAYLIPAMLWTAQTKERTVISTNTIPLQEQLLFKDIPLIAKTLNLSLKAVIVKGMNNYLCMRKFEEAKQEILLHTPQEAEEIQKIDIWQQQGPKDGSRSSLNFSPGYALWEKISAESDTCNKSNCPYFQECHFFKARKQASDAQLLIVNHHMLFADLVRRSESANYSDNAILPPYNRIILDEAHNIEDIATEYFAARVSQLDIMRVMARLASEKGNKIHGKLPLLREKLMAYFKNSLPGSASSINHRLTLDLPGLRRDLTQQSHDAFGAFFEFAHKSQPNDRSGGNDHMPGESKLRILPVHHGYDFWKNRLIPAGKLLVDSIVRYTQALSSLEKDFKALFCEHPLLEEQTKGILFEVNALAQRLNNASNMIYNFIAGDLPPSKVRWIELQALKTMINTVLVDANLNIANVLADFLFSRFPTIVLCSATLTTNRHFQFIRNRLGLTEEYLGKRSIKENVYESPFDYKKQALLAIPSDLPHPTENAFLHEATERIWQILQSCRGNAFVLFTSYSMLKSCYDLLEKRMKEMRFHPLKQGDDDRQNLLSKFKVTDRSILFGTDSFWEGVDVVGDSLRCVIIVKLPFKVPSEPLIQARSEEISARGGDPFMEYSLPQAIVKFKQGFGRLIRNKNDRGCIICLDKRLITKRYGKMFLNSLPECQQAVVNGENLKEQMSEFYRRTYHLVKEMNYARGLFTP